MCLQMIEKISTIKKKYHLSWFIIFFFPLTFFCMKWTSKWEIYWLQIKREIEEMKSRKQCTLSTKWIVLWMNTMIMYICSSFSIISSFLVSLFLLHCGFIDKWWDNDGKRIMGRTSWNGQDGRKEVGSKENFGRNL